MSSFPLRPIAGPHMGDSVRLIPPIRLSLVIPPDVVGTVREIETEGVMADKGRPYRVMFDLTLYHITLKDMHTGDQLTTLIQQGIDPDEPMLTVISWFSASDLEVIS